ncbi:hypothetical protein BN1095_7740001 [Clostridioides difficile]|uniref:Uncharacterized protein n=1 Tax=Clostridioides difficile TaxID=1496 RepID=A0A069AVH1_CLODI|nr:hypothetical protein BN1095_7740001 [Clostridioides difficile]
MVGSVRFGRTAGKAVHAARGLCGTAESKTGKRQTRLCQADRPAGTRDCRSTGCNPAG